MSVWGEKVSKWWRWSSAGQTRDQRGLKQKHTVTHSGRIISSLSKLLFECFSWGHRLWPLSTILLCAICDFCKWWAFRQLEITGLYRTDAPVLQRRWEITVLLQNNLILSWFPSFVHADLNSLSRWFLTFRKYCVKTHNLQSGKHYCNIIMCQWWHTVDQIVMARWLGQSISYVCAGRLVFFFF